MSRPAIAPNLICMAAALLAGCVHPAVTQTTGAAGVSSATQSDDLLEHRFSEYFQAQAEAGFAGEILLRRDGEPIFHRTYGSSGCEGEALEPNAVYLIGSLVKDYTKLAIYILHGRDMLSLDSPITEYLTDLPPNFSAVTVRMLVEHRSGLPDVIDASSRAIEYSTEWDYEPVGREELLRRAAGVSYLFAPGSDEHYSNLGYSLLAMIIENVSGKSYENFIRSEIFDPLGMGDTGYVIPDYSASQVADGCLNGDRWPAPGFDHGWLRDGPSWNLRGNGGMFGTVSDIANWLALFENPVVLGAKTREEFLEAKVRTSRIFGSDAVASGGSNGVYNAYYLRLFKPDLDLIMISNNSDHWVEMYKDDLFEILRSDMNESDQ